MNKNSHEDILVNTNQLPWIPIAEGIDYRILRTSKETGVWTVLFRAQAGSSFAPHKHLGAGEYYMIKGHMKYRGGEARTGDYGYEPLGVVHEKTDFPEYTELYYTNFGPVVFLDDDGGVDTVLDHEFIESHAEDYLKQQKSA